MKITIISYDNWGFNKNIVKALESQGNVVNHIDFHQFKYKYPNLIYRVYNFLLKTFFNKNLKTIFFGKKIIEKLNEIKDQQDFIVTIKGDFIAPESLLEFKKYGKKSIAYFNDNTQRCPKIIRVIPYFDKFFSFEKQDCNNYNLHFATNWIYYDNTLDIETDFKFQVFNISSKDKRISIFKKLAVEFESIKIKSKIIIYDKKYNDQNTTIEYITKHISLEDVNKLIQQSQVLLDINRKGQEGLTFRVFESIGLHKKLITTNKDIVNYDFYNPNNILLIDSNKPKIPLDFFEKDYEKVPQHIFNKYTIDGWIENVIFNRNIFNN
jgi:hypothetical protein